MKKKSKKLQELLDFLEYHQEHKEEINFYSDYTGGGFRVMSCRYDERIDKFDVILGGTEDVYPFHPFHLQLDNEILSKKSALRTWKKHGYFHFIELGYDENRNEIALKEYSINYMANEFLTKEGIVTLE